MHWNRLLRGGACGAVALLLATSLHAQDVVHPLLRDRMTAARADEKIEAYVVLKDQLRLEDLETLSRGMALRERRRAVADRLRQHADATQGEVRRILEDAAARGAAEVRTILWMGNAVIFSAEPAVIDALAALPEVDRIRPIVPQPPGSYEDVPAAPLASYPFLDDFESGALGPDWSLTTSGGGYVTVTAANGPNGAFHVNLAASSAVSSTAALTLTIDLTGQSGVGVRFNHKEFSDEVNFNDGVFISDNAGATWFKAHDLSTGSAVYASNAFDLDAAAAAAGMTYNSTFRIQFRWQGNNNIPSDGFAIDDVEVAPGVGTPLPNPTINIAQLQAPLLWDIGYDGSGVVIANIDSGSDWMHPDLVNRIWTNPGEISGNGVDDDGNGKIDDIHGWDFFGNDNNVISSDTHGTNTSGLMVGDGTNGKVTGMAPGGSMQVCRINSETNYWEAQQYVLATGAADVVSSSHSYKWPFVPRPDYHMHRQLCDMELAAGIIHSNSIGNQGQILSTYPIPFNVSAPGNCPTPWGHPDDVLGGRSSVMGCAGIHVSDDSLYVDSGQGACAWEDLTIYDAVYPHSQDSAYWDYPYGGFGGGMPGMLKPDVCTYTDSVETTNNGSSYTFFSGTSAATPQLGGGMMLLRQVQPHAQPRHVAGAIELTAVDLGPPGKDLRFGAGKLQVFDAARRLLFVAALDDQTPSLNQLVTFDLRGEPGNQALSFLGFDIQDSPTHFNLVPPFFKLALHTLDATGQASLPFQVPNDPGLVGVTAYFQFIAGILDTTSWGNGLVLSVPELMTVQP